MCFNVGVWLFYMTLTTKKNNEMFNWYYVLWCDAINFTRSNAKFIGIWKLHTLGFISFFMAINLMFISMLFKVEINIHFIAIGNSKTLNDFFGFMILFFLPPLLLNYILIFSKNQWERIRKDYKSYNGKVYKLYYILSIVLPILVLILLKLAHNLFGFTV